MVANVSDILQISMFNRADFVHVLFTTSSVLVHSTFFKSNFLVALRYDTIDSCDVLSRLQCWTFYSAIYNMYNNIFKGMEVSGKSKTCNIVRKIDRVTFLKLFASRNIKLTAT